MPQPTLVTALLDIGRNQAHSRYRRQWRAYENSLKRLCKLDLPFEIHAQPSLHEKILKWRQGKPTKLHSLNQDQLSQTPGFEQIQEIRQSIEWLNQAAWLRHSPMAELPLYIPLVNSKLRWLAEAANQATDGGPYIWIDAGIHMHLMPGEHQLINETFFRQFVKEPNKLRMLAKPYVSNTEVHGFKRDAMARLSGTDFIDRCCKGGVFGGYPKTINRIQQRFEGLLAKTLDNELMGTEESLFTILSYRHPEEMDVSLINHTTGVAGLFSSRLPKRSIRRIRHPKATAKALHRRAMTKWTVWRRKSQTQTILKLPPVTGLGHHAFDLHILLCARDIINGLWAVRSFLHYSELKPRLIIHDDGSLKPTHLQTLQAHFPEARIIPFAQANDDMTQALANYPYAFRYRVTDYSWPAIKLLDFAHFSKDRPFMVLDADVLFYKKPDEIIQTITQRQGFFMSDWQDAYTWPVDRWPAVLNVAGISKVNVGLFYLPDGNCYDLDFVEQSLAAYYLRQPCPNLVWLEQTVWAALFSTLGNTMQRLPDTYQISKTRALQPDTNCHHYVNDSHLARLDFSDEGIPHLIRNGFLNSPINLVGATNHTGAT